MQELSLNILDIAQNSVRANATLVEITVAETPSRDLLEIIIKDNGCGMTSEQVERIMDPFYTTRTTRRVGLGIPFFKMAAEMTGGNLRVESEVNVGTTVTAIFVHSHIDRMPLGDVNATIIALIQCNTHMDFLYKYAYEEKSFTLDTRELREIMGDVSLGEPQVVMFLSDYLNENESEIKMQ